MVQGLEGGPCAGMSYLWGAQRGRNLLGPAWRMRLVHGTSENRAIEASSCPNRIIINPFFSSSYTNCKMRARLAVFWGYRTFTSTKLFLEMQQKGEKCALRTLLRRHKCGGKGGFGELFGVGGMGSLLL